MNKDTHIVLNERQYIITDPNICPHCHERVNPVLKSYHICKNEKQVYELTSIWGCNNNDCNRVFVCQHLLENTHFKFKRFLNGLPKGPDWPKPIIDLKSGKKTSDGQIVGSNFIKTYLQSLEAENMGLDELAGMGFRKSIEYLVKDWAIQSKPEDSDKIEDLWLGEVIKNYFSGDLKDILERATWLGNDQSHYNRLFEEYDIDILKELIDLVLVELDRQFKKAHYIETITKRK